MMLIEETEVLRMILIEEIEVLRMILIEETEVLRMILREESEVLRKCLSHWHFVHHRSAWDRTAFSAVRASTPDAHRSAQDSNVSLCTSSAALPSRPITLPS